MRQLALVTMLVFALLAIAACAPRSRDVVEQPSLVTQEGAAISTPTDAQATALAAAAESVTACRTGDPLTNVYHPSRLVVRNRCITVAGVVTLVRQEDDGDLHVRLMPDGPFTDLLNDVNRSEQAGALMVELVPADRPGCKVGQPSRPKRGTYDYGICTGANIAMPTIGAHVAVTGPYVLDTAHGWMEIHPAWAIVWTGAGAAPNATTPSPTGATGTSSPPTLAAPPEPYYANCAAARAAGMTPIYRGQSGYRPALDRDGDGVACE